MTCKGSPSDTVRVSARPIDSNRPGASAAATRWGEDSSKSMTSAASSRAARGRANPPTEVMPTPAGSARVSMAAMSLAGSSSARAPTNRSAVSTASISAMSGLFPLDVGMDDLGPLGDRLERDSPADQEPGGGAGGGGFPHHGKGIVGPRGQWNQRCVEPTLREGAVGAVATERHDDPGPTHCHGGVGGVGRVPVRLHVDGLGIEAEFGQRRLDETVGIGEVSNRRIAQCAQTDQAAPHHGGLLLVVEHRSAGGDAPDILARGGIRDEADCASTWHA